MSKEHKSTKYLFGVEARVFRKLNAVDFLLLRYKCASFLLYNLVWNDLDEERQKDVLKAKNWTKNMLLELCESNIRVPNLEEIIKNLDEEIKKEILDSLRF